ncbi:MAG: CapA family protein [Dehalococcoidia bacterium]|jgi:poly-gamma-glutamate synthesis protein (capsule biosynthesis protein)|nr:CapA family protein [Dehalococcoidia bacterium]MDP6227680.1 CapA family protein [Dehalococcoidia bacterium]MDP7083417.1 CapA family protein [Dehalococcoidia bacterium]MDP7200280.1 CapA family protein [Dehalococcoidia bacterium]MDP7511186.1 CapA family protein [Dehalococcoidia bacterium]
MIYESESGDILIALTGEALIARKLDVFKEDQFLALREKLINADVTFGNAECLFEDYSDSPNTYAGGGSGRGTYMAAPPESIEQLQWMGIDIVSTANNHCSDFGEGGVLTNLEFLNEYGMAHAGTGANLTEARAPGYLDTPKGRVALVAAADWGPRGTGGSPWPFPMGVMAGEQAPYSLGRPGCNLIRHKPRFTVPKDVFDSLKRMAGELHFENQAGAGETEFLFMGSEVVLGEDFYLSTVAELDDLEDNFRWVREARRQADWVMFSFHNHGASRSAETPSDHTRILAHGVIDNGADLFIGHGPHRDRGIEIYNGKPIFYALGDFILQNDSLLWAPYDVMKRFGLGYEHTPADFYDERIRHGWNDKVEGWESVAVTCKYEAKQLKEIRLYPVDLGMGRPRGQAGRPVLAQPGSEVNQRVLERFQSMSATYGTTIEIESGVGVISVS